jgi:mevalonate kinase
MNIIIVNSGEAAETAETVAYVRRQRKENPEKVNAVMDKLDEITIAALKSLKKKDGETVGKLMYDYYEELKKMDISTIKLDKVIEIARKNNALGAKPTGGWGGGNCIVLVKSNKEADNIIKVYKKNGFDAFKTVVGVEGVKASK